MWRPTSTVYLTLFNDFTMVCRTSNLYLKVRRIPCTWRQLVAYGRAHLHGQVRLRREIESIHIVQIIPQMSRELQTIWITADQ